MPAKKKAAKKAAKKGLRQLRAEDIVKLVNDLCDQNNAEIVTYQSQPEFVAQQPDGGVLVRFPPAAWGVSLKHDAPDPE